MTRSICLASLSISTKSVPMTFTPIGVRMPVDSMSIRALIGIVQALDTPGNCSALSISAIRPSTVRPGTPLLLRLQIDDGPNISVGRRIGRCPPPGRLCRETEATSGNDLMMRSCVCISSAAFVTEMPGSVVGM